MKLDVLNPNIDGAKLLDELRASLDQYIVLPGREAADAVTLWIAATHAQPAWEHATRLVIKSPLKRCGKTRLLEVISETARGVLATSNISVAALVRSLSEEDPPTILLDEGDAIFARRRGERSEGAEALRGILNAGHGRGFPYLRYNTTSRRNESFPVFSMAAIAAIGDLPDTIEDRAVVIRMQRRGPGESVAQFRRRHAVPHLRELRDRLTDWVAPQFEVLREAEPELPVEDRAADVWESLIAIADAAGGQWPARARRACSTLTIPDGEHDDGSSGERLLTDLQEVFADDERLSTRDIIAALVKIEEAPWGDWYGKQFRARDLARLLRPYGVQSFKFRAGGDTWWGYQKQDLIKAWARYARSSGTSGTSGTLLQISTDVESEHGRSDMFRMLGRMPEHAGTAGPESGNGLRWPAVPDVPDVPDTRPSSAPSVNVAPAGEHGSLSRRDMLVTQDGRTYMDVVTYTPPGLTPPEGGTHTGFPATAPSPVQGVNGQS